MVDPHPEYRRNSVTDACYIASALRGKAPATKTAMMFINSGKPGV
jgi:hypothetical protein